MKETTNDRIISENMLKFLAQAVNQSSEGIALSDLGGDLKYVNKTFAEMHGYSVEKLVGKNLSILHSPEQMSEVNCANRQLKSQGYFKGEIWHTRRDGSVFLTRMQNSLVRNDMGKPMGMLATLHDITELKNIDVKLRESEKKFRTLFNGFASPVTILDRDGVVLMINAYGAGHLERTPQECLGKSIFDLIPGLDDHYHKLYRKVVDSGKKMSEETRIEQSAGMRWFWSLISPASDESGRRYGVQIISYDITQRKQAEQALKKARDDLEDLVKERTAKLNIAIQEIKQKEKRLRRQKLALEKANTELLETNRAVTVLAKNIDRKKEALQKNVLDMCNVKLIPILRNLLKDPCFQRRQADLELIINYLNEIAHQSHGEQVISNKLSDQEMRIALLIKNGLTSQQIADSLCISLYTVKTHRKNIRKKLNIDKTSINFSSYLKNKLPFNST